VNRRGFLKTLALATAALTVPRIARGKDAVTKPNIVFILSLIHISEPTRPY